VDPSALLERLRKHWPKMTTAAKWGLGAVGVLVLVGMFGPKWRATLGLDKRSASVGQTPSFSIGAVNGPAQIGSGNVQNNTFNAAPTWPEASASERDELVRTLRTMPGERFFMTAPPHRPDAAGWMFGDLIAAGWIPVGFGPPNGQNQAGIVTNMIPGFYGMRFGAKAKTPAVEYLARWSQRVGLLAESESLPIALNPSERPETVDVDFGDPPARIRQGSQ
jgi:hypothetical protein